MFFFLLLLWASSVRETFLRLYFLLSSLWRHSINLTDTSWSWGGGLDLTVWQTVRVCVCVSLISFSVSHRIHPDPRAACLKKPPNQRLERKNFPLLSQNPRSQRPLFFSFEFFFFLWAPLAWESWNDLEDPVLHKKPACIILRDNSTEKITQVHPGFSTPTFSRECLRFLFFLFWCVVQLPTRGNRISGSRR